MRTAKQFLIPLLLLTVTAAERRRDPLTDAEMDQLREVAMQPYERLKLLAKFTEARLVTIDELRADPKLAAGRGKKIHDLLEDFTALVDEMGDNLDQFQGRPLTKDDRKDFHKGLKEVIEADTKFELKLQALQTATATDQQTRIESEDYRFVLQDAREAVKSSLDLAREYSEEHPAEDTPVKKK